jgi:hypothetical protein
MSGWFERYQQGFYQEVYDELLAMKEQVFEKPVYQEASLVARSMMSRVRDNIALLIPRLKTLGYELVDGDWSSYWEQAEYPEPELNELLRAYREPPLQTPAFFLLIVYSNSFLSRRPKSGKRHATKTAHSTLTSLLMRI